MFGFGKDGMSKGSKEIINIIKVLRKYKISAELVGRIAMEVKVIFMDANSRRATIFNNNKIYMESFEYVTDNIIESLKNLQSDMKNNNKEKMKNDLIDLEKLSNSFISLLKDGKVEKKYLLLIGPALTIIKRLYKKVYRDYDIKDDGVYILGY